MSVIKDINLKVPLLVVCSFVCPPFSLNNRLLHYIASFIICEMPKLLNLKSVVKSRNHCQSLSFLNKHTYGMFIGMLLYTQTSIPYFLMQMC